MLYDQKKNSTDKYKPSEMADAIQSIEINSTSGVSLDEAKIFFNVDKITVDPELHATKVIIKINYITNDSIIPGLTNSLNIDIDIVTDNTTGVYYKSGLYNFSINTLDSGSELFISGVPSVLAPDKFPNKKLIRIKESTINNSYATKYNIDDNLIKTTAIPMNFYNLSQHLSQQPIQIMTSHRYTPSPEAEFKKVYIIDPNNKQYSEYLCFLAACKYSSSNASTVMNLNLKATNGATFLPFYNDFKLLIAKTNIIINDYNFMKTFVSEDDNIKLFYYNKNYLTQNLDLEDAKILFNYTVKESITNQNLENIYKKYGAIIFAANYKSQYIINKQNSFFGTSDTKDLNNIDLTNCKIINNPIFTANNTILSKIQTFPITKDNFLTDNITFDKVYSAITEKWLPELKEKYSYYDFSNTDTYINTTLPGKTDDEKASILNTAYSQLFNNNNSKFENAYAFSAISDSNISNLMIYVIEKYCLYNIINTHTVADKRYVVIEEEVD